MDFASVAHYLTMDVITALSLGRPFGFVKEDKDMYGYVRTVGNSLPIWYLSAALPVINMVTRLQIVQKLILPSDQDRIGLGKIKM